VTHRYWEFDLYIWCLRRNRRLGTCDRNYYPRVSLPFWYRPSWPHQGPWGGRLFWTQPDLRNNLCNSGPESVFRIGGSAFILNAVSFLYCHVKIWNTELVTRDLLEFVNYLPKDAQHPNLNKAASSYYYKYVCRSQQFPLWAADLHTSSTRSRIQPFISPNGIPGIAVPIVRFLRYQVEDDNKHTWRKGPCIAKLWNLYKYHSKSPKTAQADLYPTQSPRISHLFSGYSSHDISIPFILDINVFQVFHSIAFRPSLPSLLCGAYYLLTTTHRRTFQTNLCFCWTTKQSDTLEKMILMTTTDLSSFAWYAPSPFLLSILEFAQCRLYIWRFTSICSVLRR